MVQLVGGSKRFTIEYVSVYCNLLVELKKFSFFACRFTANDGKMKLRGILPTNMSSEVMSGNIQNLGLIRILDYTLNDIPNKPEK